MRKEEMKCMRGASNTHAENTTRSGLNVVVDWLTVSFVLASDLHKLLDLLGIKEREALIEEDGARYGFAGYDTTYRIGSLEIMKQELEDEEEVEENGYEKMYLEMKRNGSVQEKSRKWLLNFSGQACREYEILTGKDMIHVMKVLDKEGLHTTYTRLDIAIDDFDGIYTTNMFRNAVLKGQCVTTIKTWGNGHQGIVPNSYEQDIEYTMDNFYLGSMKGRFMINVYDKKLERQSKDIEVLEEHWTRTEVRFRNEYAVQFVNYLLKGNKSIGYYVRGFLKKRVMFLKPSVAAKTKNRSRDSKDKKNITRWWNKFLGDVENVHLTVYEPEKTLRNTYEYLSHSVATSLAMVFEDKEDPEEFNRFIESLVSDGKSRMNTKQKRLVDIEKVLRKHRLEQYKNPNKKADSYEESTQKKSQKN